MVGALMWSGASHQLCWFWRLLGGVPMQAVNCAQLTYWELQSDALLVANCAGLGGT